MKKISLPVLTFLSIAPLFGQSSFTQANEPAIGETRTYYVCDSLAPNWEANTGNGAVWNYGATAIYAGETRSLEVIAPSSTPFATDFPGATTAVKIEDFITSFFTSSATDRISQGYLIESADLGVVKAKFNMDPEKLMDYPMALNGQTNDIFSGNLSFVYLMVPQNPACTGISNIKYDGFGTLIQTNGISLNNVSRIHIVDTTNASIQFVGATKIVRNQYEYYDLTSSNKTPVFVHAHVKVLTIYPDPLIDMSIILSAVDGNSTANVSDVSKASIFVFPNPSNGLFNFTEISENAVVKLNDLSGREISIPAVANKQLDLSDVKKGIYTLTVTENNIVSQQRISLQ